MDTGLACWIVYAVVKGEGMKLPRSREFISKDALRWVHGTYKVHNTAVRLLMIPYQLFK